MRESEGEGEPASGAPPADGGRPEPAPWATDGGRAGEPGRARREPLTRQRIVDAALRIMDQEGLPAVTMRRVARELGVEAMSLYNHVADKEDLLGAVCQEVLARFRIPGPGPWEERARQGAREYRRLLLAHPNVIGLMTERPRPFTNPEALRAYEFALDLFRSLGLSEEDSVRAFHAFAGFVLGFAAMELSLAVGSRDDDARGLLQEGLARLVASADLPRLQEALPHFRDSDADAEFEFGLDLLIEGLRARLPRGTASGFDRPADRGLTHTEADREEAAR